MELIEMHLFLDGHFLQVFFIAMIIISYEHSLSSYLY